MSYAAKHYAANNSERGTAALMVAMFHAGLAALLIVGLKEGRPESFADAMKSFDVLEPFPTEPPSEEIPPPPDIDIPPPPIVPSLSEALQQALARFAITTETAAPEAPAPPNIVSEPTPIVAPTPAIQLPVPSPVRTAKVTAPTEGADRTAGAAALPGPGTGAGGSGSGFGAGGSDGNGAGGGGIGRPAQLLHGMRSRLDSRFLRGVVEERGQTLLELTIGTRDRAIGCRPLSSSGSGELDSELCRRMMERSRWVAATDRAGRPISVNIHYTATWSKH